MKANKVISIIGIICILICIVICGLETKKNIDEITKYEPDVIYEMCNKNIEWDWTSPILFASIFRKMITDYYREEGHVNMFIKEI